MSGTGQRLIAGAMSGTSADGVDVAIVAISGRGLEMTARLVQHHHVPYDPSLRQIIFAAREPDGTIRLAELAKMGREVSLGYAKAVNEALAACRLSAADLAAAACHGQTLYHRPPDTIQWFDPALVAAEVGCPVISDFRRADCAAGGQGAPLVPFADYILFRHPTKTRVLLNIGGIANITWLKAGGSIEDVIAFDTGPGNCVSDYLCRKHDPSGPGYDHLGERASEGTAYDRVAFFASRSLYAIAPPPKSTDGPQMIQRFEEAKREHGVSRSFEDELATACRFTGHSIIFAMQLAKHKWPGTKGEWPAEVIASGGGTRNRCVMTQLQQFFEKYSIRLTQLEDHWSQAKEAVAFALLGAATLDGVPSNVPSVTGAKRPVVLGSITPKP